MKQPNQNKNIFSIMEEDVLDFWNKSKTFQKSLEKKAPKGDYVFYDGPPFATGTPHYGHIVGSIIKDVVPRYWTMKGYHVDRQWGWDCHGLPIENIVEKEFNLQNKKNIEKIGVKKFNEICRNKVLKYVEEWKIVINRLGRWADMENSYKTMDLDFMESVWWVFKTLWDKGLIYKGYRSMHICPRCETTLSQSEVAEGYKTIKDLSATIKFKLKYAKNKTGRGVGALILNNKNEILLIRRNEPNRKIAWALPGGKLEKNENFIDALKREMHEELGIKIKSSKQFSAKPDILEGMVFETVCYETKIIGEPKIMVPDEIDKLEWFSLNNLPEINYPPSKDAIDIYKNKKEKFYFDININKSLVNVYVLAWTTTPWTLIGNVALAINENVKYAMVKIENDFYILAKERIEEVLKDKKYKIIADVNGEDLVGLKYEPLFDYYANDENLKNKENGWKIYNADFVNTEDGTGVVHIAPAFGEDDMNIGKKNNLPFIQHIGMDGIIKKQATDFTGMLVKPINNKENKDSHMTTDIEIIKYLAHNNLLFSKTKYEHSYPHCWRCDTPLLNYASSSWFVNILKIKKQMLEIAKTINWSPEHIKNGRFGKWLEGARDWSISRQRFWASVMPIWECDQKCKMQNAKCKNNCANITVIGSIKELEKLSGQKISDLHKHIVDEIKFPCDKCGGEMNRVPDVLDCWFESGSMPYAQLHYPFENKKKLENNLPAQFIAEGADQTRCWFYYLHAIAIGINHKPAFQNVIVNGIVLAEDGKKMSKKLQNYPDPAIVFHKYGADALRYYLITSPVMLADNLCFSEMGTQEALRKVIMILWNVVKFYEMFASENNCKSVVGYTKNDNQTLHVTSCELRVMSYELCVLDQWILIKLDQLTKTVTENMDNYNLPKAGRPIADFVNDLSTWYLRRSRDRFKSNDEQDKQAALQTTGYVLLRLSKIIAPFMPFIAENIWQKITGHNFENKNKSVHLETWPTTHNVERITHNVNAILENMELVRKIVELGLAARDEAGIKVRQPLGQFSIFNFQFSITDKEYVQLIKDELNVKEVEFQESGENKELKVKLDIELTPELIQEGIKRELVRSINAMRKNAGLTIQDRVIVYWKSESEEIKNVINKYENNIIKNILADEIIEGVSSEVDVKKEIEINGENVLLKIIKL
ncbi:MAG: class I tRNA ligase family protein [Patescibacteria group bacterium]